MKRVAWLLSFCVWLVLSIACRPPGERPARDGSGTGAPQPGGTASVPAPSSPITLTNRIWIRSDKSDLPGIMRLFLTDGTMVMDSCWETYRLAKWRMEPDQTLIWNEDGMDIRAKVVVLNEGELVLSLELQSGPEQQRYQLAPAPYVCPDMPR